jgi:hypothetical protein
MSPTVQRIFHTLEEQRVNYVVPPPFSNLKMMRLSRSREKKSLRLCKQTSIVRLPINVELRWRSTIVLQAWFAFSRKRAVITRHTPASGEEVTLTTATSITMGPTIWLQCLSKCELMSCLFLFSSFRSHHVLFFAGITDTPSISLLLDPISDVLRIATLG